MTNVSVAVISLLDCLDDFGRLDFQTCDGRHNFLGERSSNGAIEMMRIQIASYLGIGPLRCLQDLLLAIVSHFVSCRYPGAVQDAQVWYVVRRL
jgi:hypothetical protein